MSAVRQILVKPLHALGIFANVFRVVDVVYSQTEDLARVVGGVQVSKGLLLVIRDEIAEVL